MPSGPHTQGTGTITLFFKPFLALAFVLLHIVYHLVLVVQQVSAGIKHLTHRQSHRRRPPASFTSLQELLNAHECPSDSIRVPKHLAVVLADAAPSSLRLYLSSLWMRLGRRQDTQSIDLWRGFRFEYEAAVEEKNATDVTAIIHLARISGVQQLSVYTSQPLSASALESLSTTLQLGYKTKANLPQQHESRQQFSASKDDKGMDWASYAELRRRRTATATTKPAQSGAKGSDASPPSSPGSPASSDSETGPSSLDETLASSYTADSDAQLRHDAFHSTVEIRIGLHPSKTLAASELSNAENDQHPTAAALRVTLLSQKDGQEQFTNMVSEHIQRRADTYFSDILLPDIDAAAAAATANTAASVASERRRFSISSLRKAWVAKRHAFTSELTVAELDRTLIEAGYMGEPELLVVFGGKPRCRKLYGFPAWPIRLTDLFYDPNTHPNQAYASADFVAALRKLGKMEHRYGK